MSSVWLLGDITEAREGQQPYEGEKLEDLELQALMQSVESSNRIEGVVVAPGRLQPLMQGEDGPQERQEEILLNYRDALEWIHDQHGELEITPDIILRLHEIIQAGSGDAGQWKAHDNEIVETRRDGLPLARFHPTPAAETPEAIKELCAAYGEAVQNVETPLLAVAALVLDFLCIHPFRDGNGRVSRLLTLLGLYQQGYEVGRYVSLDRLIEESKDDYYTRLKGSSAGWHEGRHDLRPWLHFFLAIVLRAYRDFPKR